MNTPSLLGPRGTPYVDLGGDRAWRQFTKGDMVASLQWLDLQAHDPEFPEEGPIPCMAIFHAFRRVDTGAHIIPQRYAYLYGAADGNPTPFFFGAVLNACETCGFDMNDRAARFRMKDLVMEAMRELILMPTAQPDELQVQAHRLGIEVTVRSGDKTMHTELL